MNSRIHCWIEGKVQGVFFRYFTLENARKNRINGWVKNLEDGRVEVVAEGERGDIEKFLEFLRIGPKFAKVKKVRVEWEEYSGEFKDFRILY